MATSRQIEIINSDITPELLGDFRKYIQDNVFEFDEHVSEFKYNTDFRYKFMQNNGFMNFLKDKCNWVNLFDIDFVSIKTSNKKLEEIMEFVKEITNIDASSFYHTYAIIKISPFSTLIFVLIGKQMQDLFLTSHISKIEEIYNPKLSAFQSDIEKYTIKISDIENKSIEQQKQTDIVNNIIETLQNQNTILQNELTLLQKELTSIKTQYTTLEESNTKTHNTLEELISYVFPKGKDFVVMKP